MAPKPLTRDESGVHTYAVSRVMVDVVVQLLNVVLVPTGNHTLIVLNSCWHSGQ